MNSLLMFIVACSAIALFGWIVSKRTGSHAWFIETWKFNDGEAIIWRDNAADVGMIPKLGQAAVMRPMRLHRWPVVVTNQRIIIGNKTITGKQMVKYVIYAGNSPDIESKRNDGGLLSRGYSTLVVEPGVAQAHLGEKHPYIELSPIASEPSSINLSEIRIYTNSGTSFRLP